MPKAKKGHNSAAPEMIKSVIQRVEKLTEEGADIRLDIAEVFKEAKGNGLDVKALKDIIKLRKQDADDRSNHNALVKLYCDAMGMMDPFS